MNVFIVLEGDTEEPTEILGAHRSRDGAERTAARRMNEIDHALTALGVSWAKAQWIAVDTGDDSAKWVRGADLWIEVRPVRVEP